MTPMRSPLALLRVKDPKTSKWVWKVVRTERAARGHDAVRVIVCRDVTDEEHRTLRAVCQTGHLDYLG